VTFSGTGPERPGADVETPSYTLSYRFVIRLGKARDRLAPLLLRMRVFPRASEVLGFGLTSPLPGGNAASLGSRLQESLASDAERTLFKVYFKTYRPALGDGLPALLPQVYLHYDPAIVKTLRHRLPLPRQPMDFLLLLPDRQRIVIEVDGKHHFSEDEKPSLKVYADMVAADRELRLAGYEVFRFGANELVGVGAEARIRDFFDRLFRLHRVSQRG
jgi:hypothetical protein